MTRSARSTWNYLTVVAFSVISMVIALVVTPMLLRALGTARLGAARAVSDWGGYLMLLELGLGGALAPLLAREMANDDSGGVRAMLAAGFRAYLRVSIAMLGGGIVLAIVITRLVRIDFVYQRDLRTAAVIAIAPVLLMPLSPLRSLAEASQRGYIVNLFLIAQTITIAAGAVLLARSGWGISGQLLAITIGAALFGVLLLGDALLHYRSLLPTHPTRAPLEAKQRLWTLNTPTLILNICGRVGLLTDNIIIGAMLSASAIVPFFLTQRLAQIAQSQLQSIGSATWAGLAEIHARDEHDLFRKRFLELTRLTVMMGVTALLPIAAYNRAFIRLWVGEEQYAGMTLTALASVNALVLALASLWGWAFGATGQIGKLVPLSIASAALNLVVSLGVTAWYSQHNAHRALWGPLLGTSSAYLLLNMPYLPVLLRRHFGVPVGALLAAVGLPLLFGLPYGVTVMWLAAHYPPRNWLSLASQMAACAAVFAAACWLLLLTPDDRANWKLRLRLASTISSR